MNGNRGTYCWDKIVSWLLVMALLIPFCTGCSRRYNEMLPDAGNDIDDYNFEWTNAITSPEIDTLNLVLVIDTSASTLQNDPDRNWLEASCMFLNTLYASASNREWERIPGSKHAYVGVILYNDTSTEFSESLVNLQTMQTVDALKRFIRSAEIPAQSGDNALAQAIDQAVNVLYKKPTRKEQLTERNMILLFTDGYTGYFSNNPPSIDQNLVQGSGFGGTMRSYGENDETSKSREESKDNNYPTFPYYVGSAFPDFEDGHQELLKSTLLRAKEHKDEIFVLMFNPSRSNDGGWEQFKMISNYTKRNKLAEILPVIMSHQDLFENMSMSDMTWPEDYVLQTPSFLDDPLYAGGVFSNPDVGYGALENVNYLTAYSSPEVMSFYATLAANMLSGSSIVECIPSIESYESVLHYSYSIEVPTSGISALMCFFFSNDGIGGIATKGSMLVGYPR